MADYHDARAADFLQRTERATGTLIPDFETKPTRDGVYIPTHEIAQQVDGINRLKTGLNVMGIKYDDMAGSIFVPAKELNKLEDLRRYTSTSHAATHVPPDVLLTHMEPRKAEGDAFHINVSALNKKEEATITAFLDREGIAYKQTVSERGNRVLELDSHGARQHGIIMDAYERARRIAPDHMSEDYHYLMSSADARRQLANPDYKPVSGVAREHAPFSPHAPHGGRAAGIAGLFMAVVGTFAAAQDAAAAENKPVGVGDVARAAVDNILPVTATQKGRYAEAGIQVAARLDITGGVAENFVRSTFRAAGANVDPGIIESAKKTSPTGVLKDVEFNERIRREEMFLMSKDHPGQLASLKVKGMDGKDMDVAAALRHPDQRQMVLDQITRLADSATTPNARDLYKEMKEAATEFVDMEGRRRVISAVTVAEGEMKKTSPTQTASMPAAPKT